MAVRHIILCTASMMFAACAATAQQQTLVDGGSQVMLGRYTTEAAEPRPTEAEPLDVVAQISYPRATVRSVGDAVRHTLVRTGYSLVEGSALAPEAARFLELPLPESQRVIGPYRVQAILDVLLGKTWTWHRDAVQRRVWFTVAPSYAAAVAQSKAETVLAAPRAGAQTQSAPMPVAAMPASAAMPTATPIATPPTPAMASSSAPVATQGLPPSSANTMFFVAGDEQTVKGLLHRWADLAKVPLVWSSNVDYPLTRRIQAIQAGSLDAAIEQLRGALVGVQRPLWFVRGPQGLMVRSDPPGQASATPVQQGSGVPFVASPSTTQAPSGDRSAFAALPSETTLVPVLVRLAEAANLVATLNGRQVTVATLDAQARADLPLTDEARAVKETDPARAIVAILKTYASYRSDVSLTANFQQPNILAITSSRAASVATGASTAGQPAESALAKTWALSDSRTLRAVVERWGQLAGLRIQWHSAHDFPITDEVRAGTYSGTFKQVLGQLAARFGQLPTPLSMKFSPDGLALLITDAKSS